MTLKVSELFVSPQGEGGRSGEVSVFVRLQGCSAKHACLASGVVCDTEFESGREVAFDDLLGELNQLSGGCRWIVWTGGEPLDQLTPDLVAEARQHGWSQAVETSGVRPFPREFRLLFDWVACSPKVAEHVLARHFGEPGIRVYHPLVGYTEVAAHVHELRYVRHAGQDVPHPSLVAYRYYLSPHSDGLSLNAKNVAHVVELVRQHPTWRVSLQVHKLLGVL